eukprot:scaffold14098_cov157-Skeletonema_marinoi.AAC.2
MDAQIVAKIFILQSHLSRFVQVVIAKRTWGNNTRSSRFDKDLEPVYGRSKQAEWANGKWDDLSSEARGYAVMLGDDVARAAKEVESFHCEASLEVEMSLPEGWSVRGV